jgi:hypothetical protein
MNVKLGINKNIPSGIPKDQYLQLVKSVYEKRAAGLEKRIIKRAA